MAGSLKWFIYEADDGASYAVKMDESNGEATDFSDYDGTVTSAGKLPKGFKMRHANVIEPVSGARRSIPIGKTSSQLWTGAANVLTLLLSNASNGSGALIAWTITGLVGTQVRDRPFAADTGLTDGDAT